MKPWTILALAVGLFFAPLVLPVEAAKSFTLSGPYVFEFPFFSISSAIGVLNFGSNGAVTATLLIAGGEPTVFSDTATGTYSVNANGTVQIGLTRADTPIDARGDIDSNPTLDLLNGVIEDHGGFTVDFGYGGQTAYNPAYGKMFKRTGKNKFNNGSLSGSYVLTYVISGTTVGPGAEIVGLLTFDGRGKLTGTIFAGDVTFTDIEGTYTVNSDGSATIHTTQSAPPQSGQPIIFENASWSTILVDDAGTQAVFITVPGTSGVAVGRLQQQQ